MAKEQARELHGVRRGRSHPKASDFLDEETVKSMSDAERRAVARQRGYNLPQNVRRLSVEQFNRLQAGDKNLGA